MIGEEWKTYRELTPDDLDFLIFQFLRREYPRKVRKIVRYISRDSDNLHIYIENSQAFAARLVKRLKYLEEKKRVVWSPSGWKLR